LTILNIKPYDLAIYGITSYQQATILADRLAVAAELASLREEVRRLQEEGVAAKREVVILQAKYDAALAEVRRLQV
jgi:hypothetical protein